MTHLLATVRGSRAVVRSRSKSESWMFLRLRAKIAHATLNRLGCLPDELEVQLTRAVY